MSKSIELLSPAKDYDTAIAAINHGADAVYIGASSFGARAAAGNSLEDLKRLVDYAHQFRARIYTTVNTIVYDHELRKVEHLVKELYKIGIDALIVQDMGLLRLDLPPIELHASTQCDTRTPEKARFLQDVGFSQIVLARELTLSEITEICNAVTIPVETFVHGALCVSYSGRCHAGEAMLNRSANRGECPQVCRMKYDLIDNRGNAIVRDRYLLSLRDFNASSSLSQLLKAGVSSFKIEGRLKDISYVKNITAYYRTLIDKNISTNPKLYQRASCGKESLTFSPNPQKSFNRGFTDYFLTSRRPDQELASIYTPKSLGEELKAGEMPDNGDGISFFDKENDKYTGFRVNRVEGKRIIPARPFKIPKSIVLHRTFDNKWEQLMSRGDTSTRKISVDIELNRTNATAVDERGCKVVLPVEFEPLTAKSETDFKRIFAKTGNTIYTLRNFKSTLSESSYIPPSVLTELRRKLLTSLDAANVKTYNFNYRRKENLNAIYPYKKLDYRDNVANKLAQEFYHSHGVTEIEPALETISSKYRKGGLVLMTCRYCILRQIGRCLKKDTTIRSKLPISLRMSDGRLLQLRMDCAKCEMQIIKP